MSHGLPGILIAIEGIDGGGKTTQVQELVRTLHALGISVTTSKEPTDGPHGRALRSSGATGRLPLEQELALFVADRRDHVAGLLLPLLRQGGVVIVDRYYFSTAAYQGARGADVEAVIALNESFAPQPDAVLILDLEVDVGQARIRARGDVANHFEDADELRRVQRVFQAMKGDHIHHIDATPPVERVHEDILAILREGRLGERMERAVDDTLDRLRPMVTDPSVSAAGKVEALVAVFRGREAR